MSLFFRILQHLLPRSPAWQTVADKTLRKFLTGIAASGQPVRGFIDDVWDDMFPSTTRELELWEEQFGLQPTSTEADRRLELAAEWKARGGQSPHYIQTTLQAAGFPVYVHEWWSSGPPWVARDPRTYTQTPLIGQTQCGEPLAQCGEPDARCSRLLANEVGYLVNLNWSGAAPPVVPDDSAKWPFFLYIGDQTFPNKVNIPSTRRREFERLLLKICPAQQWIVVLVDFVDILAAETGSDLETEGGDLIALG